VDENDCVCIGQDGAAEYFAGVNERCVEGSAGYELGAGDVVFGVEEKDVQFFMWQIGQADGVADAADIGGFRDFFVVVQNLRFTHQTDAVTRNEGCFWFCRYRSAAEEWKGVCHGGKDCV